MFFPITCESPVLSQLVCGDTQIRVGIGYLTNQAKTVIFLIVCCWQQGSCALVTMNLNTELLQLLELSPISRHFNCKSWYRWKTLALELQLMLI